MEQEGVIKYRLAFQAETLSLEPFLLSQLNTSRSILKQLHLIGQEAHRYEGFGYGNISIRSSENCSEFLISGTQTGVHEILSVTDIAYVTEIDTKQNTLCAKGGTEPSSEAMTHGVLYQLSSNINAVVHVHSPEIWSCSDDLKLAHTAQDIPYGTPEMATAVTRLASSLIALQGLPFIFVMKGHEDGVVVAGKTLEQCTGLLLELQSKAKAKALAVDNSA